MLTGGLTVLLPFKATFPTLWSMDTDAALAVIQLNTTADPAVMVVGLAVSVAVGFKALVVTTKLLDFCDSLFAASEADTV